MTSEPFAGRLLIGLNGCDTDGQFFRYASMAASLGSAAAGHAAAHKQAETDPEVRFVFCVPSATADKTYSRAALRDRIRSYFTAPEGVTIGYDVVKSNGPHCLSTIADNFEGDLLLLDKSQWSDRACARIGVEAPCPVWLVPNGWAPVVRRLIVPTDFSPRSITDIRAAIEIARRSHRAKCVVLHVYWTQSRFDNVSRLQELRKEYEHFMSALDTRGVALEPLFVEGRCIGAQIAQAVRQNRVDLVVMSTAGRTHLSRLICPSIVDRTIRDCDAAVLVLRSTSQPLSAMQAIRERLRRSEELQFS